MLNLKYNKKLNIIFKNQELNKTQLILDFLSNYCFYLKKILIIKRFEFYKNDIIIEIDKKDLLKIITFLKYHTNAQFNLLSYITAIDYLKNSNRFAIIYDLLSYSFSTRIRIKLFIKELEILESICSIFKSANWHEREVWDMFGIHFLNHPDLRRILTDYGFQGHPLRKDFPLSGHIELRYDDFKKRLIYTKTQLIQNYRHKY